MEIVRTRIRWQATAKYMYNKNEPLDFKGRLLENKEDAELQLRQLVKHYMYTHPRLLRHDSTVRTIRIEVP